jgi:NADPH2:quinone reductase
MRAMVFESYGEPEVMRLRDVPVPEPQDSEVLIRVGYAGVNPSDSKARSGQSESVQRRYQDLPCLGGGRRMQQIVTIDASAERAIHHRFKSH